MPELGISVEKVCQFAEEAREFAGREPPTAPRGISESDDGILHELEDEPDEPFRRELREFFAGLTLDERANLVALLWLGRGDIELDEWDESVAEAARRIEERDFAFPFEDDGTPEYLEEALNQFDQSCV